MTYGGASRGRHEGVAVAAAVWIVALVLALTAGCGRSEPSGQGQGERGKEQKKAAEAPTTAPANAPVVKGVGAGRVRVVPAPKPVGPMAAGAGCVTPACHGGMAERTAIHAPVAAGQCNACHGEDTGGHVFPLRVKGMEGCTNCHPVVGIKTHQHAALKDGCLTCHNPHASDVKFLLPAEPVERVCAKCHEMPLKRFAHSPFAEGHCTVCHEPHESQNRKLLRGGEGPEHCFTCHADMPKRFASARRVHEPATKDCANCHNPHSTEFPHQLKGPIDHTCLSCHAKTAEHIEKASFGHPAVKDGKGCVNCHDAHATDHVAHLKAKEGRLCLQCHDKELKAGDGRAIPGIKDALGRKFLHGPVKSDDCAACHDVHGGSHESLLKRRFVSGFYASFDLGNYDLCFGCHDAAMVKNPTTPSLTDFRDGERNLHFVHVNRQAKGRTCRTCHEIHGSDQPRHIAASVPFEGSGWSMPIKFEPLTDGGRCTPGCHGPQAYRRGNSQAPPTTRSSGGSR